jgi:anaerobic selenocysteine-containing dehydrogenase
MTNGWIDIKNTDMMLIMGGNPAENHPCGFKWALEAKRNRNAKMLVVDPRLTRTASTADMFLQIRAGADIAFLGGLINYALENNRIAKDYLLHYTNASFLIKEGFKLPEDGLYSGFDETSKTYDRATWNYQESSDKSGKAAPEKKPTAGAPPAPPLLPGNVAYDFALENPQSVLQLLKKQYSRYTPEMVERITGIPKDKFLKAADLFTSIRKDGATKKVATIIYSVGWTQHTYGSQIIRSAAMLQLLMGNIGRAGGGINALRGHSNIQGATDMAGIFDNLPGYQKVPTPADTDYAAYLKRVTPTAESRSRSQESESRRPVQ